MKKTKLILLLLVVSFASKSQSLCNASFGTISSSTYILQYSIGEIAINTIGNDMAYSFTQGLLQPSANEVSLNKKEYVLPDVLNDKKDIQYYPNPTTNQIQLSGNIYWADTYSISTSDGRLVKSQRLNGNIIKFDNLLEGIYFVKLSSSNSTKTYFFKVIKNKTL